MLPFARMLEYGNIAPRSIKQLIYSDCCYVLYSTGELYGYGNNSSGTLGQGDLTNRYDKFYLLDTDVKVFACCDRSLVYIKNDNTIWCTGESSSYSDSTAKDTIPRNITSYFSSVINVQNISKIQTARTSIVIRMPDGTVYGIGKNTSGELGTGTTNPVLTLSVIAVNTVDMSANVSNVGILDSNSNYSICGLNNAGQLGTNNMISSSTFGVRMTNVRAIQQGLYSSYCMLNSGISMACGYNSQGELGVGLSSGNILVFTNTSPNNVDIFYNSKINRNHIFSSTFGVLNGVLYSAGNGTSTSRNTSSVLRVMSGAFSPIGINFSAISSGYVGAFMYKGTDIYYTGDAVMNLNGTGNVGSFTLLTKGLPVF